MYYDTPPEQVRIPILGKDIYVLIRYEAEVVMERIHKMANASSWPYPIMDQSTANMYTGRTELSANLYARNSSHSWAEVATESLIASLDHDNRFGKLANMGTMLISDEEYYALRIFSEETRNTELEKTLFDQLMHNYHAEYETYVKAFFYHLENLKDHTQVEWK